MNPAKIIAFLVILAGSISFIFWLTLPLAENASAFAGTTNIVFKARQHPRPGEPPPEELQLTAGNAAAVQHLVTAIRLEPKPVCKCGIHTYQADFQTTTGLVSVSFCRHCFDVVDPRAPEGKPWEGSRDYRMPKDFYKQFRWCVEQQTNVQWRLLPP